MQAKLTATFQRQAWVRDDAVNTEEAEEIEAAATFLALSAGEARSLLRESARSMTAQETDWFAQRLGLFEGFGKSDTGYLYFEADAIGEFAEALGVDIRTGRFDEGAMRAMRSAHATAADGATPRTGQRPERSAVLHPGE